jgi:hypothetical protein
MKAASLLVGTILAAIVAAQCQGDIGKRVKKVVSEELGVKQDVVSLLDIVSISSLLIRVRS